jgi:hypothetical protein
MHIYPQVHAIAPGQLLKMEEINGNWHVPGQLLKMEDINANMAKWPLA